jgi:hypothetical protein
MTSSTKCPLCGRQKARRACPALGRQICAVCCGTKRLTEIQCPSDCPYLASAREHPPAVVLRQQEQDLSSVALMMRDLNRRQSELLFLVLMFLNRHDPQGLEAGLSGAAFGLERIIDDDVAETAGALAATFETASRGLIYEHRPASRPAERLMTELKPVLAKAREGAGSSFDRDAAVVFRHLEQGVRDLHRQEPVERRRFLAILERVLTQAPAESDHAAPDETPRLIVP